MDWRRESWDFAWQGDLMYGDVRPPRISVINTAFQQCPGI